MLPEPLILLTRRSPHTLHHFLAQPHGGREDLGISSKNVTKVNVNEVAIIREQKVVKMSVSYRKQIGNHTVASCTTEKTVLIIEQLK